jgi:predicted nuclease of predicted toxin-antitoxin system
MIFLIDEDLPRSLGDVVRALGHEAKDIRDLGLRGSSDAQIAVFAKLNGYCLLTADKGFANVRAYPPHEYAGLVVLDLPPRATSATIHQLLRELLARSELVQELPGKLAVVHFGRIRLR